MVDWRGLKAKLDLPEAGAATQASRPADEAFAKIKPVSEMITSAGDIRQNYESLGVVWSTHNGKEDFDYTAALNYLVQHAAESGADGVIHVSFNERQSVGKEGCFGDKTVAIFEVRCWGTMIRILPSA